MRETQLREGLARLDSGDLMDLVVKLYSSCAPARKEIDVFLQEAPGQEAQWKELRLLLRYMGNGSSPVKCKEALLEYVKACQSPKREARAFFAFAQAALDAREAGYLEAGILRPAASAFGKGLEKLTQNPAIWAEMEEETYRLAKRFYGYNEEEAWKALRYFQEAKRTIQKT